MRTDIAVVDFTGMKFVIQDSVMHIEGASYGVKIALYDGRSFVELISEQAVYDGKEIVLEPTGNASLLCALEEERTYELVGYICNTDGVRCSELFYPDVSSDGECVKQGIGGETTYTVKGENKRLTVYLTEK